MPRGAIRGALLASLPFTLLACEALGVSAGPEVRVEWEVPGSYFIAPVVHDSLVVSITEDGLLVARQRFTGARLWGRQLAGTSALGQMTLAGTTLLVPAIYLYAVDVRTGALLWELRGTDDAAGVASPAVSGDTVFVPGFSGFDAMAIDLHSGRMHWSAQLGKTVYTPAVAADLVVFALRSTTALDELVALDRGTGEERWRVILPDSAGFAGGTANGGVVAGDRLIVGTTIAEAMAISLADGEILWRRSTGTAQVGGGYLMAPTLLESGVVLYRGDGLLEKWSPFTGEVLWSTPIGGLAIERPRECTPHLCLGNGRLWIIDRNGQVLWAYGGGGSDIFLSNVTVAADGWMYAGVQVGNSSGRLIAFRSPVVVGATP